MKPFFFALSLSCCLSVSVAKGDFFGTTSATKATSPDGNLIVRISPTRGPDADDRPSYNVVYYKFDAKTDAYSKNSSFVLNDYLGQMMYVSNAGDLVIVSLGEKEAITLYTADGKRVKAWDLDNFLTKKEIDGCAKTGSTLQWLEEATFGGRELHFRGPSSVIRAMQGSYTVMRGATEGISFSGRLDAAEKKLTKDEPDEEEANK